MRFRRRRHRPGRWPDSARARPLPYDIDIASSITPAGGFRLKMTNRGRAGAALAVYDNSDAHGPWHFTVGAGDQLESEHWHKGGAAGGSYDLTLKGPDGLHQRYAGALLGPVPDISLIRLPDEGAVELLFVNRSAGPLLFDVRFDAAYASGKTGARRVQVAPGATVRDRWNLANDDNWYDLAVRWARDPEFLRHFAGKLETGRAGLTDPAIGTMRL